MIVTHSADGDFPVIYVRFSDLYVGKSPSLRWGPMPLCIDGRAYRRRQLARMRRH